MSIIRIIANNIELDFVKESLRIRKDNNAFGTDFKISHSTFPFLVIENEKTSRALGTREMASILKKKVVQVTVIEMGERYPGELQILTFPKGFRKCNIRFGLEPLEILEKPLAELLPVISVIPGETNPVPFTEENISTVPGTGNWETFPIQFAGKIYPEVKFQFPQMAWKNKFYEGDPEEGDEWYLYMGYYNKFLAGTTPVFVKNQYGISGGTEILTYNRNVPSPQLFLLAILEYAFSKIGWTIAGPFVESGFIKRILVLSTENNLCKVNIALPAQSITFVNMVDRGLFGSRYYCYEIVTTAPGTYTFTYDIQEQLWPGGTRNATSLKWQYNDPDPYNNSYNPVYTNTNDPDNLHFTGTFEINVPEDEVGNLIRITWLRNGELSGFPTTFNISWVNESKPYNMMHPTIPLGRYAPDWSLATYINEIKNKFCLSVGFDNSTKTVNFDYAKKSIGGIAPYPLREDLALAEYDMPQYNAFILKNANDEDTSLFISKAGIIKNKDSESDLTAKMESQFKLVPYNGFTADLSGMEDKDGVGLMLFDPQGFEGFELPLILPDYNGQTLAWEGVLGIYNQYHKDFIQFRLNASSIRISGRFTEVEISAIDRIKKIHTGHQAYIVKSMDFSETKQGYYDVNLELESINL